MVLLLKGICGVAQTSPSLEPYCATVAGYGISLAEMSSTESRRLRLDLVLESVRLCPKEFIAAASLYPPADSPVSAIRGMMGSADQASVALARTAAAAIQIPEDQTAAAVAQQLALLLSESRTPSSRNLAELERRDAEDLARMAARQSARIGEQQDILLLGIFIEWIANRAAINAAFQSVPSSQEWLRPFAPGIGMVGGGGGRDFGELESAVTKRARAHDGPVDKWYRGFKIEK
jgi:hypothetical protein